MSARGWEVASFTMIAVAVTAVRVIALNADPLGDTEGGFIYDWGEWAKNARYHALWGVWTLDDYNPGLYTAFGHTIAVRLMFALLGVGQTQVNLVSVASGLITLLTAFALVRHFASLRTALLVVLLLGMNPFSIAYDRSGYPESLQVALMSVAVAGILIPSQLWSVAGGASCALAVAAKVTGVTLLPIVALIWMLVWGGDRFLNIEPRFSSRRFAVYCAAVVAVLIPLVVVFLVPHWSDVWVHMADAGIGSLTPVGRGARPDRVSLFGYADLGFRMNGFFRLQWYLLGIVVLFAAGRLTRVLRQPVTQLELACWIWLGFGLVTVARMYYQPDRRFLFLVPPLAVLSALVLGREFVIGPSEWTGRRRQLAFAASGATALAFAAFYVVPHAGSWRVMSIAARMGYPLTFSAAGGLVVTVAVVAGGVIGAAVSGRVRLTASLSRHWLIAVLASGVVALRWTNEVSKPRYTLAGLTEAAGRLSDAWPSRERVILGGAAATVAMGTRAIGVSTQLQGLSAEARFHPLVDLTLVASQARSSTSGRPAGGVAESARVECALLPLWLRSDGTPHYIAHLRVVPERLASCRLAVEGASTNR